MLLSGHGMVSAQHLAAVLPAQDLYKIKAAIILVRNRLKASLLAKELLATDGCEESKRHFLWGRATGAHVPSQSPKLGVHMGRTNCIHWGLFFFKIIKLKEGHSKEVVEVDIIKIHFICA